MRPATAEFLRRTNPFYKDRNGRWSKPAVSNVQAFDAAEAALVKLDVGPWPTLAEVDTAIISAIGAYPEAKHTTVRRHLLRWRDQVWPPAEVQLSLPGILG
jgi:hypothetical protein